MHRLYCKLCGYDSGVCIIIISLCYYVYTVILFSACIAYKLIITYKLNEDTVHCLVCKTCYILMLSCHNFVPFMDFCTII